MDSAEFMFMLESFGQLGTKESRMNKMLAEISRYPEDVDLIIENYDLNLNAHDIWRINRAIEGKLY